MGTPGMGFQRFNWSDPDGRLMIWYDDGTDYQGARFITYNFQDAQGSFEPFAPRPLGNGFSGFATNEWDTVHDARGEAVATSGRAAAPVTLFWDDRTPSASAVRGVRVYSDSAHSPHYAVFPYADGTAPFKMRDFSDFALMRLGLPRSLTPASQTCDGGSAQPLAGYDGCAVCNAGTWELRLPAQCRSCSAQDQCASDEQCRNGICVGAAVYSGLY
jgi:hypothetical protein